MSYHYENLSRPQLPSMPTTLIKSLANNKIINPYSQHTSQNPAQSNPQSPKKSLKKSSHSFSSNVSPKSKSQLSIVGQPAPANKADKIKTTAAKLSKVSNEEFGLHIKAIQANNPTNGAAGKSTARTTATTLSLSKNKSPVKGEKHVSFASKTSPTSPTSPTTINTILSSVSIESADAAATTNVDNEIASKQQRPVEDSISPWSPLTVQESPQPSPTPSAPADVSNNPDNSDDGPTIAFGGLQIHIRAPSNLPPQINKIHPIEPLTQDNSIATTNNNNNTKHINISPSKPRRPISAHIHPGHASHSSNHSQSTQIAQPKPLWRPSSGTGTGEKPLWMRLKEEEENAKEQARLHKLQGDHNHNTDSNTGDSSQNGGSNGRHERRLSDGDKDYYSKWLGGLRDGHSAAASHSHTKFDPQGRELDSDGNIKFSRPWNFGIQQQSGIQRVKNNEITVDSSAYNEWKLSREANSVHVFAPVVRSRAGSKRSSRRASAELNPGAEPLFGHWNNPGLLEPEQFPFPGQKFIYQNCKAAEKSNCTDQWCIVHNRENISRAQSATNSPALSRTTSFEEKKETAEQSGKTNKSQNSGAGSAEEKAQAHSNNAAESSSEDTANGSNAAGIAKFKRASSFESAASVDMNQLGGSSLLPPKPR
jgi:hypothetical protein